jgi:hypothetical protein
MNATITNTVVSLYEDNAGGLHMSDGTTLASGMEHNAPGALIGDIVTFADWIDDATARQPHPAKFQAELIAEWDGSTLTVYIDRLGNAGRRYAGIEN